MAGGDELGGDAADSDALGGHDFNADFGEDGFAGEDFGGEDFGGDLDSTGVSWIARAEFETHDGAWRLAFSAAKAKLDFSAAASDPIGSGSIDFLYWIASVQYNAERWMVPEVDAGDLVLYPSYLLHGVPPNEGEQRLSLALNAIPDRLKSFGYEIGLTPNRAEL